MNYSTINLDALRKQPKWNAPATYHLQEGSGNCCYLDAPGYPTYFTRNVYTQHGNSPRFGAQLVITIPGEGHYVVSSVERGTYKETALDLHKLWLPLPEDHLRVQAWEAQLYKYFASCYADEERPEYGRPDTLIYPVPSYKLKALKVQEFDKETGAPKYSNEYLAKANEAAEQFNADERARAERIAIPINHQAVRLIRRFYPDHQPRYDWIDHPELIPTLGNWYETEAEQPTPETCTATQRHQGSTWKHPINGTWCQWCGWRAETPQEVSQ